MVSCERNIDAGGTAVVNNHIQFKIDYQYPVATL